MKKILSLLLSILVLLSLCACSNQEVVSYPAINKKLTWDAINAFPLKRADMTEDEMRQLCVDFYQFSKTVIWTPRTTWDFEMRAGSPDTMEQGSVYGGLPYVSLGSGNVYRLMDYIDQETGVVDMTEAEKAPTLFGNQCSFSASWAWSRVVNSANFDFTNNMTTFNGFLTVGPYTYDSSILRFSSDIKTTADIVKENGEQTMYESYAAMKLADGLVTYNSYGHTRMCTGEPVVVYNADNQIDPKESYLYITEQADTKWHEQTNEAGDTYLYKSSVQKKISFKSLYKSSYIPFTFAEFSGADPIEDTICSFSHTEDTITPVQLNAGKVDANYSISDIYAIARDADGNEVIRAVKRASQPGLTTLNFNRLVSSDTWGPYADGNHTVEIICQLGSGERLTLYTGKLVS